MPKMIGAIQQGCACKFAERIPQPEESTFHDSLFASKHEEATFHRSLSPPKQLPPPKQLLPRARGRTSTVDSQLSTTLASIFRTNQAKTRTRAVVRLYGCIETDNAMSRYLFRNIGLSLFYYLLFLPADASATPSFRIQSTSLSESDEIFLRRHTICRRPSHCRCWKDCCNFHGGNEESYRRILVIDSLSEQNSRRPSLRRLTLALRQGSPQVKNSLHRPRRFRLGLESRLSVPRGRTVNRNWIMR